jgi:hypothetical protein
LTLNQNTTLWRSPGADLVGLFLGAVIAGGFIYWTAANIFSGVHTSKQGIYRRDESPIRYWIHTIIIAAATALLIFYWFYQIFAVTGAQSKIQSANKTSLLMPDPLPIPAVMTATTSTPRSILAPGQA